MKKRVGFGAPSPINVGGVFSTVVTADIEPRLSTIHPDAAVTSSESALAGAEVAGAVSGFDLAVQGNLPAIRQ